MLLSRRLPDQPVERTTSMIVGVTATRSNITEKQEKLFEERIIDLETTSFRHGDCVGGDARAHEIVQRMGIYVIVHPPLNSFKRAYCNGDEILEEREYLERNRDIVRLSDSMIAMPRSKEELTRSGTWYTIRFAKKLGKELFIIFPDGTCETW